jgi:hypothetical protein
LFWDKLEQSPDGDGGAAWLPCIAVGRSAGFVTLCRFGFFNETGVHPFYLKNPISRFALQEEIQATQKINPTHKYITYRKALYRRRNQI